MKTPRLEVHVNDELLTTAAVDDYGVLTAILCWVLKDPERVPESVQQGTAAQQAEWLEEELSLDVGGLGPAGHLNWPSRKLAVGDEVKIRVLPPGPADAPDVRARNEQPDEGG